MAYSDPVDWADISEAEEIYLYHFSSTDRSSEGVASLVIKKNGMIQLFYVTVYSNGIDSRSRGHVSVVVERVQKRPNPQPITAKDNLSWTFSIIDVNGVGRYYQSFSTENVVDQDYKVNVPYFLKRSVVLEQSDEFLSNDVLIVRCELSCMSYAGPTTWRSWPKETDMKDIKTLGPMKWDLDDFFLESDYEFNIEPDLDELIRKTESMVIMILSYRTSGFHPGALEPQKEAFNVAADEIQNTYLASNPLFKAYMLLKEKLKRTVSLCLPDSEYTMSEQDEYFYRLLAAPNRWHVSWKPSNIRLVVGEQDKNNPFSTCWSWSIAIEEEGSNLQASSEMEGECSLMSSQQKEKGSIAQIHKMHVKSIYRHPSAAAEQTPSGDAWLEKITRAKRKDGIPEERNGMPLDVSNEYEIRRLKEYIEDLKETIEYLLSEETELQDEAHSCVERNFVVETMEGTTFEIPFKDGRETIGSKMIAASPVFERMLTTPMQEKHLKRVKLSDIGFHTFVNFLLFLHAGRRTFEPLYELWELYEMADKYDVPDLMRSCADEMAFCFALENIDDFEALAALHSDDRLFELVNSFKKRTII